MGHTDTHLPSEVSFLHCFFFVNRHHWINAERKCHVEQADNRENKQRVHAKCTVAAVKVLRKVKTLSALLGRVGAGGREQWGPSNCVAAKTGGLLRISPQLVGRVRAEDWIWKTTLSHFVFSLFVHSTGPVVTEFAPRTRVHTSYVLSHYVSVCAAAAWVGLIHKTLHLREQARASE